jgi:ribosomal protein L9
MFQWIKNRLTAWDKRGQINDEMSYLDQRIASLRDESRNALDLISTAQETLRKSETQRAKEAKALRDDLREAHLTINRLQESLNGVRDELRTAKEITIPGLIASHDIIVSRMEKETKLNHMKIMAAEQSKES